MKPGMRRPGTPPPARWRYSTGIVPGRPAGAPRVARRRLSTRAMRRCARAQPSSDRGRRVAGRLACMPAARARPYVIFALRKAGFVNRPLWFRSRARR